MRWQQLPMNKHFWAFYYYCKRQGDRLRIIKNGDGTVDLLMERSVNATRN